MKKIILEDNWQFAGCDPRGEKEEWRGIDVPGDVNAALIKYGDIPDPHYETRARDAYWITAKEWWYRKSFNICEENFHNAELCLDGVDGIADIWLNGKLLGRIENAFREHRFEIGKIINTGKNELLLRFKSLDQFFDGPREHELWGWESKRTFIRKPQFSFGWDWALPLPSIGLSGKVWLELGNQEKFVDVSLRTYISGRVDFAFEVSRNTRVKGYEIDIEVTGHGTGICRTIFGESCSAYSGHGADGPEATGARHKSYCSIEIPDPRLWWPSGFGAQPLYDYKVKLKVGGKVAEVRKGRFGLRECAVAENPFRKESGPGYSYEIVINGTPVFCKGANWIPPELWPAGATEEQYRYYLRKAKEAHFNMLRVWGGGIYEKEIFYQLCDEYGIMVWQDFMFASAGYPVDVLREEIKQEADFQLKRLRNHCSIVLWCGCNEDVYAWQYPDSGNASAQADSGGFMELSVHEKWQVDRLHDDPEIYSMILRGLVGLLGQGAPYVESSPASRDDCGNIPSSGNSHISSWKYILLQTRNSETYREHFNQVCSFNSEFCIQGADYEWSMKRFLAPENLWPPNDAWIYHIQRGHKDIPHHEQHILIAEGFFGKIDTLSDYVKFSQAAHLELMRSEFESCRRDRPDCGGTMVWMLNDCWPTGNWSIINYYGEPKPAYYAAKRACAPLLQIIAPRYENIEFFFSNDTPDDVNIELEYGQETLAGKNVWKKNSAFKSAGNSCGKFAILAKKDLNCPKGDFLFVKAFANGKLLDKISYFPDCWKDIPWPDANLEITIISQRKNGNCHETELSVSTDKFARLLHLTSSDPAVKMEFSDNYFDLPANEKKIIIVKSDKKITDNLKVLHWKTSWE